MVQRSGSEREGQKDEEKSLGRYVADDWKQMLAAVSREEMMIQKVIYPLKKEKQKWPSISKGKTEKGISHPPLKRKIMKARPVCMSHGQDRCSWKNAVIINIYWKDCRALKSYHKKERQIMQMLSVIIIISCYYFNITSFAIPPFSMTRSIWKVED